MRRRTKDTSREDRLLILPVPRCGGISAADARSALPVEKKKKRGKEKSVGRFLPGLFFRGCFLFFFSFSFECPSIRPHSPSPGAFGSPNGPPQPPAGGAPSRHTSTWEAGAVRFVRWGTQPCEAKWYPEASRRAPRRCQAAEEAHGPQAPMAVYTSTAAGKCAVPLSPPRTTATAERSVDYSTPSS
jgi:hypothetical protein